MCVSVYSHTQPQVVVFVAFRLLRSGLRPALHFVVTAQIRYRVHKIYT